MSLSVTRRGFLKLSRQAVAGAVATRFLSWNCNRKKPRASMRSASKT